MSGARHKTILVVEDEPSLRTLYRRVLVNAGFDVVTAGDGIEALRRYEDVAVDAVVLDLGLPLLGGREVARELLARRPTLPIVIVTGQDTSDLDERDFACILQKPFIGEALVEAVEGCFQGPYRR